VDFCFGCVDNIWNCFDNRKRSINKISHSKPGEEFENGIREVNGEW
jgi:hypothetical protein